MDHLNNYNEWQRNAQSIAESAVGRANANWSQEVARLAEDVYAHRRAWDVLAGRTVYFSENLDVPLVVVGLGSVYSTQAAFAPIVHIDLFVRDAALDVEPKTASSLRFSSAPEARHA